MRVVTLPCLLVVFGIFGFSSSGVFAQTAPTELNLVARYTFDGNFGDATGDSANNGVPSGVPEFACGINGSALALNSGNDFVRIPGGTSNNVNRRFETEDFTLSFYFKPIGTNGTQYLVSKRDTNCMNLQFLAIRYAPLTRTISAVLRQNNQEARVDYRITNAACWQHVVLLREGNSVRLFLNAREVGEARTSSRVDVDNTGDFLIGSTNCRTPGETPFDGLIDEMRIYSRALRDAEVEGLYERPDRIVNTTRRLFLGESIDIELNSACGVAYDWLPMAGVDDPTIAQPTITPVAAGRQAYRVRIQDAESNCTAIDSIVLQVIDPALLDCSQIFLPKAFTPNGIGPTENETFGISNPFAISELVSFEVYDRYGAQMFQSTDAFARWDGTFKGSPVQPGVAVWRVVYRCQGNEFVESGSVMVMR